MFWVPPCCKSVRSAIINDVYLRHGQTSPDTKVFNNIIKLLVSRLSDGFCSRNSQNKSIREIITYQVGQNTKDNEIPQNSVTIPKGLSKNIPNPYYKNTKRGHNKPSFRFITFYLIVNRQILHMSDLKLTVIITELLLCMGSGIE